MADLKAEADVQPRDSESQEMPVVSEKKGSPEDQKDMHRMGKTQELRRNFRFVSIFGYSMILMATWETALTWVGSTVYPRHQLTSYQHPDRTVDERRHWWCNLRLSRHSNWHGFRYSVNG